MPSYLAPILLGSTVAHRIQAGTRSTNQPPGCCSRIFTRDPCAMAGLPCGSAPQSTPAQDTAAPCSDSCLCRSPNSPQGQCLQHLSALAGF